MQDYSESSEHTGEESDYEEDSLPQLGKRRIQTQRNPVRLLSQAGASSSTYTDAISSRLRIRRGSEVTEPTNQGWTSHTPKGRRPYTADDTDDDSSGGAVVKVEEGASIFNLNIEHILYKRKDGQILVKLKGRSYLDAEWMTVQDAFKRGKPVKSKYAKFEQTFDPLLAETVDEDTEFFRPQYKQVDKILSAVEIFPIVHPKKANEVKGKWSEFLTVVCSRLLNSLVGKIKLGLYLSHPLDRLQKLLPDGVSLPWTTPLPDQPVADLGTMSNRLYLDSYKSQDEFWRDLGLLLRTVCDSSAPKGPGSKPCDLNVIFETLHGLAQALYHEFYGLQQKKHQAFVEYEHQKKQKLQTESQGWQEKVNVVLRNPEEMHLLEALLMEGIVYLGESPKNVIEHVIRLTTKSHSQANINAAQVHDNLYNGIRESVTKAVEKGYAINGTKVKFETAEELLRFSPGHYSWRWLFPNDPLEQPVPEILVLRKSRENAPDRLLTDEEINAPRMDPKFDEAVYLVKWIGVSYLDCTWESSKILDPDKIRDYRACSRSVEKDTRIASLSSQQAHVQLLEAKNYPKKKNRLATNIERQYRQMLYMTEYRPEAFHYTLKNLQQYKNKRLLRPYQIESLNWLIESWTQCRNVILADEMGLGKTIQTMAFLMHLTSLAVKMRGPFLIIAPLSTLAHWKRTVDEWSTLNGVLYYDHAGALGRQRCKELEFHTTDINMRGMANQNPNLFKFQVLITSFEVFLQDLESVMFHIPFQQIVVDEAHRLKNNQSRLISALRRLPCERILLLTGTPVQNNTKELWTLLDFLHPGRFGTPEAFTREFGNLETAEQMKSLQSLLQPYLLRRMKEDVEKGIPPLRETIVEVEMTAEQKRFYQAVYEGNKEVLKRLTSNGVTAITNLEMQLRKVCDHPWLIDGSREQMLEGAYDQQMAEDLAKGNSIKEPSSSLLSTASISPINSRRSLVLTKMLSCSGKLVLLEKLLDKCLTERKKMLIFSQFTRMLALIEEFLTLKGLHYELIDGGTKSSERQYSIDRFNAAGIEIPVFLLSTKAGGVGINLTSANVVVIFDSDWNPQNDVQATARAHRIGQENEVQVYRLIANKTYEALMFERSSKKLGLDKAIFLSGDFKSKESRGDDDKKPTKEEMETLLKKGILGFLENPADQPAQAAQDIETILAQSKVAQYSLGGGYTFAKSSFVNDKADQDLQLDDPDFWERALKTSISQCERLKNDYDTKEKIGAFATPEAQRSFMIQVSNAVQKVLDAKLKNEGYSLDDEFHLESLLQKIWGSAFHTVLKSAAYDLSESLKTGKKRRKGIDVSKLNLAPEDDFNRKPLSLTEAADNEGIFESDSDESMSPKKKKGKGKKQQTSTVNDEGVSLIIQEIKGTREQLEKQLKREEQVNRKREREMLRQKEKEVLALAKETARIQKAETQAQKAEAKKKPEKPKKDEGPKAQTVMQAFEAKPAPKPAEVSKIRDDAVKEIHVMTVGKTPEKKKAEKSKMDVEEEKNKIPLIPHIPAKLPTKKKAAAATVAAPAEDKPREESSKKKKAGRPKAAEESSPAEEPGKLVFMTAATSAPTATSTTPSAPAA